MRTHFEDKFKGFAVALQAALLKAGKAPRVAEVPVVGGAGGDVAPPAKRVRTNLGALGQAFIDAYLDTYIGLKGNVDGRTHL